MVAALPVPCACRLAQRLTARDSRRHCATFCARGAARHVRLLGVGHHSARGNQTFSRVAAGANTTMLFLAVAALIMPAVFDLAVYGSLHHEGSRIEQLSLWTSAVLIAIYLISFLFVLKTHKGLFIAHAEGG